jgi:hypothetical protein
MKEPRMRTHLLWPIAGVLLMMVSLAAHLLPGPERSEGDEKDTRTGRGSHDGRKRGPAATLGDLSSPTFDYWKPEKAEPPILARYRLRKGQEYAEDGEIIIKELGSLSVEDVFEALRKQMNAPDAAAQEIELRREAPTITQLVIRKGIFVGEGNAELRNARLVAAVVETGERKYLVRLVGPKEMVSAVQPDFEKFLTELKK